MVAKVETDCKWRRHSYDGTFTFELTDMPSLRQFIATVYHKGREIAHRYYDYRFTDVQNHEQAWDAGLHWLYGAQDLYQGMLAFDLIEEEELI